MPAVAWHLLPNVRVVDGVSYPSTRAGLAAAIADLPPEGGCVVLPPNCPLQFESAEPVLIQSDNVTLIGHHLRHHRARGGRWVHDRLLRCGG